MGIFNPENAVKYLNVCGSTAREAAAPGIRLSVLDNPLFSRLTRKASRLSPSRQTFAVNEASAFKNLF